MNFLAHLFLTPHTKESLIGSLLADFIRTGNDNLHLYYSPQITYAVIMHRKIDMFTDTHPDVASAVHLLFSKYRHYSRIVVDIFFDHYLTKNWHCFSDIKIDDFIKSVHRSFRSLPMGLPDTFCQFTKRLKTFEILEAYGSINNLNEIFQRIEMRIKHKPGINRACEDLIEHYEAFDQLFLSFFPQVINYLSNDTNSKNILQK